MITSSRHVLEERKDRVDFIKRKVGFGQVIKEVYTSKGNQLGNRTWKQLTDTGVVLILSEERDTLITVFLCDMNMLQNTFYHGNSKKIPSYLRKKVQSNQIQWFNYVQTKGC